MSKKLLSNDSIVMAGGIRAAINNDKNTEEKKRAQEGVNYFNYKHDILDSRIIYVDDDGLIRENKYASNFKITHPFLTELVKQKRQYLIGNPVELTTIDENFQRLLDSYIDENFQLFLHQLIEGGSTKGFDYAYAFLSAGNGQGRLCFQVCDSLSTVEIKDDDNVTQRYLRYYTNKIYDDGAGRIINYEYAEIYDAAQVWYFVSRNGTAFILDTSRPVNPAPHALGVDSGGNLYGMGYNQLPFYRFNNNFSCKTDLEPIKSIVDDYDIMNAALSNNLQDFNNPIYVVKGFEGEDLSTLSYNLRGKKTIGVGSDGGGLDIKAIDIPVEARKLKLDLDRENIYKFGMGFDSSQVGDGNITNIVLMGRYTLLRMKAKETEVMIRAFLKWAVNLIKLDIKRLTGTDYSASEVEFEFDYDLLVNKQEESAIASQEASARLNNINALLAAAPKLDNDSVLQVICEQFDLEFDEVKSALETQSYTPLNTAGTDPSNLPSESTAPASDLNSDSVSV